MIHGIGVDVIEIARIRRMREKHGQAFLDKCFTPAETEYCLRKSNPDESLAARFAAKEAVMKALGSGWGQGVAFANVEVVPANGGAPEVRLHGGAEDYRRGHGVARVLLSMSHCREYAVAQAVAVRG